MYRIVTTFRAGSESGERLIDQFHRHCSSDMSLWVFVNGAKHPTPYSRLESIPAWKAWSEKTNDKNALKFGHKVFALQEAAKSVVGAEWLIWLDADVEITDTIDFGFLDPTKTLAYLGRPWFDWSECGFVGYNFRHDGARTVLNAMWGMYRASHRLTLKWGHDSATFDEARKLYTQPNQWQDLTGHLDPSTIEQKGLHVWPRSPLAKWSVHHKGPKRKAAAYS